MLYNDNGKTYGGNKTMKKIISTPKAPAAIGPYSQAIEVNGMVYTSGVIPINPEDGSLVTGTIEEQTHQVLKNMKNLLEAAGTSLDQVVKTTVFIKDMNDFVIVRIDFKSFLKKEERIIDRAKDKIVVANSSSDKATLFKRLGLAVLISAPTAFTQSSTTPVKTSVSLF